MEGRAFLVNDHLVGPNEKFDEGQDIELVERLYDAGAFSVDIESSTSIDVLVPDDKVARKVLSIMLSFSRGIDIDELPGTDTLLRFVWDF